MATLAAPVRAPSARRISTYWLAWTASITFFAGFYALLVPLPRYLSQVGLADWQIGLVLGAFGIASLVGRPISGVAVDWFGARPLLLLGAGALAVGALGVAQTENVVALLGLRVLQAIGYVAFTTASTSLVVSLVAPGERAGRLATFGAAANIAIAFAPASIALLLSVAPLEAGLLASAALALAAAGLALSLPRVVMGDGVRRVEWRMPRRVWLPMLATALLGAGFAAFFQFAPILADRRAMPAGVLYSVYGLAIIATRVVGGRVLDRFSVGRIVMPAAVLMAAGFGVIAANDNFALALLAVSLVAASGGLFHPALLAHHAALLPETPGRASAAFYVAFDLGIGVGSWLFGAVLQIAGVSGLYWVAAAIALAVVPLGNRLSPGR